MIGSFKVMVAFVAIATALFGSSLGMVGDPNGEVPPPPGPGNPFIIKRAKCKTDAKCTDCMFEVFFVAGQEPYATRLDVFKCEGTVDDIKTCVYTGLASESCKALTGDVPLPSGCSACTYKTCWTAGMPPSEEQADGCDCDDADNDWNSPHLQACL